MISDNRRDFMAKQKKVQRASDGLVQPSHIQEAQGLMFARGAFKVLGEIAKIEPDIASFIAVASKDIAAGAMFDCNMERTVAHVLHDRVVALALSVFHAHYLAVWAYYKDMTKETLLAELEKEIDAAPPFPPPPEEGGTGATAT
jgi:hypothetical protein